MDIDWQLIWEGILGSPFIVNLEVKRRRDTDCLLKGEISPEKLFDEGLVKNGKHKFRKSSDSEVNVLAVTLLSEINRDVQLAAEHWLNEQTVIDALLLFTRFSINRSGFDVHVREKRHLLDAVLDRQLSTLDLSLHSCFEFPYDDPAFPHPMRQSPKG